jgi:hypothetical protein
MSAITDCHQAYPNALSYARENGGIGKYNSWTQVAGYFDGDGSVHLRADSPVVLRFALVWVDNSFGQLSQLRSFLCSQGIKLGNVLRQGVGVFRLQVASPKFALTVARLMEPYCFKKREELRILVDYYESKISGTQAILLINDAVHNGVRLGRIRETKVLPLYSEGKRSIARARGIRAAEVRWERQKAVPRGEPHSDTRRT